MLYANLKADKHLFMFICGNFNLTYAENVL